MRSWQCLIGFLLLALNATAQTPGASKSPLGAYSQPSTPPQAAVQPVGSASTPAPPKTMDQVVDRAIEREHALMEMLKTRTPVIETYLQDLKFDPRTGPTP